jgi:hypothetical protein
MNFKTRQINPNHKMTLTWRKIIACAHIWLGHRLGHGHSRWREGTRVGVMMQVRPLAGPLSWAWSLTLA